MTYLSKFFLGIGVFSILGQSLFQESHAFSIKNNLLISQSETCPIAEGDYYDGKDKDTIQKSFAEAKCEKITLQKPTIYYRYYSSDGTQRGRYMTDILYTDRNKVIQELALNQDWGNFVTMVGAVILPSGTVVYIGKVAPQENKDCKYEGGGNQVFVPERFLSDKETRVGETRPKPKKLDQVTWFSAPQDMPNSIPYKCEKPKNQLRY